MIPIRLHAYVQPIADRVAQHLEIISKTFPTNQDSAHGIYDYSQVIYDEFHENPHTYNPYTSTCLWGGYSVQDRLNHRSLL